MAFVKVREWVEVDRFKAECGYCKGLGASSIGPTPPVGWFSIVPCYEERGDEAAFLCSDCASKLGATREEKTIDISPQPMALEVG